MLASAKWRLEGSHSGDDGRRSLLAGLPTCGLSTTSAGPGAAAGSIAALLGHSTRISACTLDSHLRLHPEEA
jgi:hypothetical protein